jgi:hypothetical protein
MDATFVEERRQALEHFIVRICRPVLSLITLTLTFHCAIVFLQNEVCSHEKLSQTLELQVVLTASAEVSACTCCLQDEIVWSNLSHRQGLIAGKELLKVASGPAAYVPTTATVTSLWSSLREGVFLASNVQPVEIKTDDAYAKVSTRFCSKCSASTKLLVDAIRAQIGEHIDEYEKRIREVKRCSDLVYAAQRSEGYEMSRFGSYLTAMSEHEKLDPEMKRIAEVRPIHNSGNW